MQRYPTIQGPEQMLMAHHTPSENVVSPNHGQDQWHQICTQSLTQQHSLTNNCTWAQSRSLLVVLLHRLFCIAEYKSVTKTTPRSVPAPPASRHAPHTPLDPVLRYAKYRCPARFQGLQHTRCALWQVVRHLAEGLALHALTTLGDLVVVGTLARHDDCSAKMRAR